MSEHPEKAPQDGSKMAVGIAIGVAIGAALGVAMDNIAIDIGRGVAVA